MCGGAAISNVAFITIIFKLGGREQLVQTDRYNRNTDIYSIMKASKLGVGSQVGI